MYITPADNRTNFKAQIISYDPGAAKLARSSFQFFSKETDAVANKLYSMYTDTYLAAKIARINYRPRLVVKNLTTQKELSVPIGNPQAANSEKNRNAYLRLLKRITRDKNPKIHDFWVKDEPGIIETTKK